MNPVSVDIKDILVKECGFVFAQDLFISAIPAEPYNCIVIFDTSNEEIQNTYDNENYRFESVMIWVRDVDYESAYLKANSIVSVLNNKANFVINGSRYLYCSMCSGINGIEGFADTNILTMNFRLQRKATNEFDTEYLTFEKLVNILKEGENITFTITPDKQIYINGSAGTQSNITRSDIIWNEYTVYIGVAVEGTEEADESWSIMKQISNPEGDVVSLQIFSNVAWANRYSL